MYWLYIWVLVYLYMSAGKTVIKKYKFKKSRKKVKKTIDIIFWICYNEFAFVGESWMIFENWAKCQFKISQDWIQIRYKKIIFFWRVWSWLRMNAGGMPKTCKSNEMAFWEPRTCTKLDKEFPSSGRRVSNT